MQRESILFHLYDNKAIFFSCFNFLFIFYSCIETQGTELEVACTCRTTRINLKSNNVKRGDQKEKEKKLQCS
jgi:hypothetical protein